MIASSSKFKHLARVGQLVIFLVLEGIGLAAWSAVKSGQVSAGLGATVGFVCMVGGFLFLLVSLINSNTPACTEVVPK